MKLHADLDSDLVDPLVYNLLIGSLMYLVNTSPYICFALNNFSQYMVEVRQIHWVAAKHVLRYLKGTIHYRLRYAGDGELMLHGFVDSDWAGDAGDNKSTSGCCFSFGSGVISWFSRKQALMALTSGLFHRCPHDFPLVRYQPIK